jgi:hypothetical protein
MNKEIFIDKALKITQDIIDSTNVILQYLILEKPLTFSLVLYLIV